MTAGAMLLATSCSKDASGPGEISGPTPPALSEAEVSAALTRGRSIAAQAFSLLSSNLLQAVNQHGVSNALPYCSAQAIPLTSLVARTNGVSLRRVSHRARNPANQADDAERALIEQMQSSLRSGEAPRPVVVATATDIATFYAPIVITNNLCLKCHGQPEQDVALENLVVIRKLYLADAATGFRLGELRGLWRIDLRRATLASER